MGFSRIEVSKGETLVLHAMLCYSYMTSCIISRRFLMLCFGHITVTAAKNACEKQSKDVRPKTTGNGDSE